LRELDFQISALPLVPCFSETRNRQKAALRVSQKHTAWPNLCHTHGVTATTRQAVGARGCVPQGRGSAENAADQAAPLLPNGTLRIKSTRTAVFQPNRISYPAFRSLAGQIFVPLCLCGSAPFASFSRISHGSHFQLLFLGSVLCAL